MSQPAEPGFAAGERRIRAAFAALALISLVAGFLLHVFAAALGLEADTGRLIATAFIAAGVCDAAVLYFWDWLFNRSAR